MRRRKERLQTYKDLIEKFDQASKEEKIELIKEFPEKCLITGLERCDSYYFDVGVV